MKRSWLLFFFSGLLSIGTYADDTEIYVGNSNTSANPNMVFIFDTSGSMGDETDECKTYSEKEEYDKTGACLGYDWWGRCNRWPTKTVTYCSAYKTRLEASKEAVIDTIQILTKVNVALMRYNTRRDWQGIDRGDSIYRGGYLSTGLLNVDEVGNKEKLIEIIKNYDANGGTPLTEAVHEAFNYYKGAEIDYARKKEHSNSTVTYLGATDNVRDGSKYISPITDQCQANHIVLFTDGDSSRDGESNEQIRSWANDLKPLPSDLSTSCSSNGDGNKTITNSCLEELAYYMYAANSKNSDIPQVHFHAIGGFLEGSNSQTFLDRAAALGGGVSGSAKNTDDLKLALLVIKDRISDTSGTFAAPAVAVNAFNSLEQLDQMYYSVFKPHAAVGWSGNIKRFRLGAGDIVDVNNNSAIDNVTGFFRANARSFWTLTADAPDGDSITKGGMASRLPAERKIYSNLVSNTLTASANLIHENNVNNIPKSYFGVSSSDDEYLKLLQWVRGLNVKGADPTAARRSMEDPLHSQPILINYGELTIDGKKVPDSTLFIGTNSGYLHAFDTNKNAPQERFAFIPKELLPVAAAYYTGAGGKRYGLDGHISSLHLDTNNDMIVNNNEKAYVYIGMRRGGSSYYALDVSDRDAPTLAWQINGKYHAGGPTAGFEQLGQTWSRMIPVDVKWIDGNKRKVLIFAGGYDPQEDNNNVRTAHEAGNAIYMVDALTGELLWKASSEANANLTLSDMTSAIVGNVVAVDNHSTGYVDLLYVADLGGRIWRVDFDKTATTKNSYATGGMIADLGKDNDIDENVRFYTSLDVVYSKSFDFMSQGTNNALVAEKGKPRYVLNIGSGYRAHPLDQQAVDNFYVVFDYNTESAPSTYASVNKTNLEGYAFSNNSLNITATLKSNNGFYIRLKNSDVGEKILSKAITLNNVVYFSSFRPSSGGFDANCKPDTGSTRLYSLRLKPGRNSVTTQEIKTPGIPSDPLIVVPPEIDPNTGEPSTPKILISTKLVPIDETPLMKKTYWQQVK